MGSKDLLLIWAKLLSFFKNVRHCLSSKYARPSGPHYFVGSYSSATTLPLFLMLLCWLNRAWLKITSIAHFIVSIGKLSSGSHNYYLNLGQEDYYLEGGEPPGTWFGAGAEALGLKGNVSKEVLSNLFRGYSPDGKKQFVMNAGMDSRIPAWDTVASPPKSVSVLWSQADFHIRKEIEQAHLESVKKKNQFLQDVAGYCRKGKDGTEQVRAKLIKADFVHGVSRALDPQLHTHTLLLNLGVCEDGHIRAIDGRLIYKHKMAAGAVYRAELACQLRRRLGVRIIPKKTWFEVAGVPQEFSDHFSKRRKAIVAELGTEQLEIASAAAYAALKTRSPKSLVPPRSVLFASWQQVGREFGFDINKIIPSKRQRCVEPSPQEVETIVKRAIDRLSQKRSSFNESLALYETLAEAMKQGINPESILTQTCYQLDKWPKDRTWTDVLGRKQYTNLTGDKRQRKLISYVDTIQRRSSLWDVSCLYVNQVVHKYLRPRTVLGSEISYHVNQFGRALQKKKTKPINRALSARQAKNTLTEQEAELVRGLVRNRGSIQVVNSRGISNMHTILKASNESWEKNNLDVWGFSLTRHGATKLETETGIRSRSFRAFELMRHPTFKYRVKYSVKQLVQEALLSRSYPLTPLSTKNKILVIHQAHQLNYQQMNELLSAVKKHAGRVILVGSADLRKGKTTAFDHVAYRVRRNDRLQTRTDYYELKSQPIQSHSIERERK